MNVMKYEAWVHTLIAMLSSTLVLVAIMKYDPKVRTGIDGVCDEVQGMG
jgi:hypothetical protein